MKETLPATHLLRQILLFAIVTFFLLLTVRAGYALWQFTAVEQLDNPERLFVMGCRFDLSLIGAITFMPIVVGSLLGMFEFSRGLAKLLVSIWLILGMAFVLFSELLTLVFIATDGVRPDAAALLDLPRVIQLAGSIGARYPLPATIGVLLAILILIAYVARMEVGRFLRFRLSRPSALLLALVGGVICVIAARSEPTFLAPMLAPSDAVLGGAAIVDQLAMNSGWTLLHSLATPWF